MLLLLRCNRCAIAVPSLCNCGAIAVQLRCHRCAIAVPSLCNVHQIGEHVPAIWSRELPHSPGIPIRGERNCSAIAVQLQCECCAIAVRLTTNNNVIIKSSLSLSSKPPLVLIHGVHPNSYSCCCCCVVVVACDDHDEQTTRDCSIATTARQPPATTTSLSSFCRIETLLSLSRHGHNYYWYT